MTTSRGNNLDHKRKRFLHLLSTIVRRPAQLLDPGQWRKLPRLSEYLTAVESGKHRGWVRDTRDQRFQQKQYATYDDYLQHQKSKLTLKGKEYLVDYDRRFHAALLQRLRVLSGTLPLRGKTVICLAARIGTEVRAFLDLGCFAVGIDLNPGEENKYVVYGDFHNLQFPDASVDVVYTNSFDHVFDKERIVAEISRVLRPQGVLLLELLNTKENQESQESFGTYESLSWSDTADVAQLFTQHGFKLLDQHPFEHPWLGTQYVLRLAGTPSTNQA